MADLIRLNLGCGRDKKPGYVNIDISPDVFPDLIWDIRNKLPFSDSSCREIIAQDILEHLTLIEQKKFLSDLRRIIFPQGKIYIRTPNTDEIISKFPHDSETRNMFIFGNNEGNNIWDIHKFGHTRKTLIAVCLGSGLFPESISEKDTNYECILRPVQIPELKNILYINQTLSMGGAETFSRDLLDLLSRSGINIKIYSNFSKYIDLLRQKNLKVFKVPYVADLIGDYKGLLKSIIYSPLLIIYYLNIIINNRDTQVVLLSGFTEKIFFTPLAKMFSLPVVWIEYGPLTSVFKKFLGLPKYLYRLFSVFPDMHISSSYNSRHINTPLGRIPSSKSRVIQLGSPDPYANSSQIPIHKNITVVCVSRLENGKGHDLLLNAWQKVIKTFPKARLFIVGSGNEEIKLKILSKDLNLSKNVVFTGFVPEVNTYLKSAKIVVLPSVWTLEGFGLVATESMALGKPIIAFNLPPLNEILKNHQNAVLAADSSPVSLADNIIFLLKNPILRLKLGLSARKTWKDKYELSHCAERFKQSLIDAVNLQHASKI